MPPIACRAGSNYVIVIDYGLILFFIVIDYGLKNLLSINFFYLNHGVIVICNSIFFCNSNIKITKW